jgi:hypothetical protein
MPVEYEIDPDRRRIRTRCVGPVALSDVLAHLRVLAVDPALPKQPDVLLDFSELTTFPDRHEVQSVALQIGHLAPTIEWQRCAIVAPQDLAFGIGRMFEMLSEPSFRATMVFRKREDAEQWLDRAPRAPAGT